MTSVPVSVGATNAMLVELLKTLVSNGTITADQMHEIVKAGAGAGPTQIDGGNF